MPWTDQCVTAFKIAANIMMWKNIPKEEVLRRLSKESGIPQSTLKKWWEDNRSPEYTPEERPICRLCKKNLAELGRGKKMTQNGPTKQLCSTCRRKVTQATKRISTEGTLIACQNCDNLFYIKEQNNE